MDPEPSQHLAMPAMDLEPDPIADLVPEPATKQAPEYFPKASFTVEPEPIRLNLISCVSLQQHPS